MGPNGACRYVSRPHCHRDRNNSNDIEEFNSDYVIVDTPGQMELFAFRASGPYIVKELTDDPKALLYLFDATFSSEPLNYVSNMFLATAVYTRFLVPQLYILSKTDLVQRRVVKRTQNGADDQEPWRKPWKQRPLTRTDSLRAASLTSCQD